MLQFTNGHLFATGACSYWDQRPSDHTTTPRIVVAVQIDGFQTQAVVDTGGVYLVCDPEIPALLELDPSTSLGMAELIIRGYKYKGQLYRLPIRFLAEEGESIELEVTAFTPRLESGQEWRFPSFLGLQGCLEFLRFAVDPGANVFYFGPL